MGEEETKVYTKVLLVGLDTGEEPDFDHSMEELKSLAEAAYKEVVGIITQRSGAVNKSFYVGTGKVAEIGEYAGQCGAEELIFDNTLSPSQIRNLGKELELPILDRTGLILDIFAIRAKTKEAKLQVETARLQYILPRLVGMRENLSRQGGTGGSMSNKGAGETKLELDRRKIEHRITELKKELEAVSRARDTMRKKRSRSDIPKVALVGYTNAGKSTILNHMLDKYGECGDKTVLEKNMLFATLDTQVRCIRPRSCQSDEAGRMVDNSPFFLADTVGFIDKLPHGLVKAFRSTLEEVRDADLLIQVVDFSDEHYKQHMEVTAETLKELGAGDIPRITVYNKADRRGMEDIPRIRGRQIYMAASMDCGIEELKEMIEGDLCANRVERVFLVPYEEGGIVSYLMENATVLEQEYRDDGVWMKVNCNKNDADKYGGYLKNMV